jgi:hypothetical protein
MKTIAALVSSFALLAACGGQSLSKGPGSTESGVDAGVTQVRGSVNGISLASAYAIAVPDNSNANTGPTFESTALVLGIANKPLACDTAGIPNSTLIGISIKLPGTAPVGPGSYAINLDPSSAYDNLADVVTTDGACTQSSTADCTGGTLTITSVTASLIVGTFTLIFDTGDEMNGNFSAVICPSIPAAIHDSAC